MRLLLTSFFLYFFNIKNSYAYLDPSSASYIITIIIGFFAGIGAFLSIWWRKIKDKIKSILNKQKDKSK